MNNQLEEFARKFLKESLACLPESNQLLFRQMYSHKNLSLPINDVVDAMSENKLDWAMQQVHRSLEKLA